MSNKRKHEKTSWRYRNFLRMAKLPPPPEPGPGADFWEVAEYCLRETMRGHARFATAMLYRRPRKNERKLIFP